MADPGVLDLSPADLVIVQQILEKHVPSRPVFIFGPRVAGRACRRSDLELAVGGDAPLGRGTMADLREAFGESGLPIGVDIVDLTDTTGTFRARLESEWLPLRVAAEQLAAGVTA